MVLKLAHGEFDGMAVGLVQVMDGFLIAAGLLIFSLGLYELFIGEIELPAWLVIQDLDSLKAKLAGVIVMVMAVTFLERLESTTDRARPPLGGRQRRPRRSRPLLDGEEDVATEGRWRRTSGRRRRASPRVDACGSRGRLRRAPRRSSRVSEIGHVAGAERQRHAETRQRSDGQRGRAQERTPAAPRSGARRR